MDCIRLFFPCCLSDHDDSPQDINKKIEAIKDYCKVDEITLRLPQEPLDWNTSATSSTESTPQSSPRYTSFDTKLLEEKIHKQLKDRKLQMCTATAKGGLDDETAALLPQANPHSIQKTNSFESVDIRSEDDQFDDACNVISDSLQLDSDGKETRQEALKTNKYAYKFILKNNHVSVQQKIGFSWTTLHISENISTLLKTQLNEIAIAAQSGSQKAQTFVKNSIVIGS